MRKINCFIYVTKPKHGVFFLIDSGTPGTPIQTLHYILSYIISGEPKDGMFLEYVSSVSNGFSTL